MNMLKTGSSSTLDIIAGVREKLESIKGQLPPQLRINALSDQSIFVRSAISGVVREAIIAACLTAIMILIFLGSWRSTLIIAVSIPLSILCSLITLYALHETINIMTLGGTRAGRRHSGGRCHRGDRKYQPQSRVRQRDRAGHP